MCFNERMFCQPRSPKDFAVSYFCRRAEFGCELWVLRPDEIDILRKFQRYVGRRCQRFPTRTPNYSAVYPLGWISIERYVKVKKLLFLRTIMVMTDDAICKQMLVHRTREYQIDVPKSNINEYNSPVFDILNTCKDFDILDICINMIENGFHFDKQEWKRKVLPVRIPSYLK